MTDQTVIDLGTRAIWVAIQIAAPTLLAALIVGLIVSIFQAATQINEQTLAFIPKVIAMTIAAVVCGPWILQVMIGFTTEIFAGIPNIKG
jgi:flagellar biosynthetic protein FliQ